MKAQRKSKEEYEADGDSKNEVVQTVKHQKSRKTQQTPRKMNTR